MDRARKDLNAMEPKYRKRLIRGLILTVIGATLFFGFESMIGAALRSQLVIDSPPNEFTKMWNKAPLPIGLDIFLFNLENPRQFANGAKAKVKEIGPYSYNLGIYHEIISFNSDKTRVKYWEINSFEYLPDNTAGKLTDKITTVNFPVYALANMVRDLTTKMPLGFAISPVAFGFVNLLFGSHGEGLIKETTVGELLNGYTFGILETIDTLTKPLGMFGIKMPDTGMPENKFGFLWTKNYTKGGPFEAYTGQKGTKVLDIYTYKGERTLRYYDEPSCNVLAGTEGTILEPMPSPDKIYNVFNMATCKTFDLKYMESTSFGAIPTYRYSPDPVIFSSPSKNPKNKCFCYEDDEDWCDGAFDLSRCLDGAPVAYSFPHFMGAGKKVQNNVIGMEPDPELHTSFLDIEKHMGSPLKGSEKLQMNGMLRPIPYLVGFRKFRKTFYPLLWMKKSAALDDDFTMKIRLAVYPLYGFYYLSLGLLLLGIVMLASAGRSIYKNRGQVPSSLNEIEQISTDSSKPLKGDFSSRPRSFERQSFGNHAAVAAVPPTNNEPNYSYPQLDPDGSRLIHRRPSNHNNPAVRSSYPNDHNMPAATIQIDKPVPLPSRNRSDLAPPSERQIYLRSPTPGGDDISITTVAPPLDSAEVDDLDHGWTSINDIVQKQPSADIASPTEVDATSVPEVRNTGSGGNIPKEPGMRRRQATDRANGGSWSPPGSIDNQP